MAWDLLQYIAKEFIVRQVAEVNWCKVCVRWLGLITAHKFDSPSPLTLLSSFLWDALYFLATALIIELQCICFGFLSPLRSEVSWFVQIPNWIFSPKGSDLLQSWESLSPWMEWVTLNPNADLAHSCIGISKYLFICIYVGLQKSLPMLILCWSHHKTGFPS